MHAAVVEPRKIAKMLGLRQTVGSLEALDKRVEAGLPRSSLEAVVRHVFGPSSEGTAFMQRVISSATYHRRGTELKPQEGERVERLARVVATAEHVWGDAEDARAFLLAPHAMLRDERPIVVALTELGARRVETLLWSLFYGIAA